MDKFLVTQNRIVGHFGMGRRTLISADEWDIAVEGSTKEPKGASSGKYWLTVDGKFIAVHDGHYQTISTAKRPQDIGEDKKAIRITSSPPEVAIELWAPASVAQITALTVYFTRETVVIAADGLSEILHNPTALEVETIIKLINAHLEAGSTKLPKSVEFLGTEFPEAHNE